MKSRSRKIILLTLAGILSLALAGPALAKKFELAMSTAYMNTHPTVVNAWEPWFKEVAKLTDGEVQIAYFNPNTLTPSTNHYESTIDGALGIGGNGCGLVPGKFPLSEILEIPGLAPSAEAGSLIMWELFKQFPDLQNEYKDIKMLWMWASATYQLHTTKKPVRNLDDLKGLKIIVWSKSSVSIIKALGANPIHMLPTDSYLALERGMADGVFCPLAPIISFKISEAAKYTTLCDLYLNGFYGGIGPKLFESLSPKARQVLVETTGDKMARLSGLTLDEGAINDGKKLKAAGHTFITLSPEERDKWIQMNMSLRDDWLKNVESKGYKNAKAMLDAAYQLRDKYAPTTGRGYTE